MKCVYKKNIFYKCTCPMNTIYMLFGYYFSQQEIIVEKNVLTWTYITYLRLKLTTKPGGRPLKCLPIAPQNFHGQPSSTHPALLGLEVSTQFAQQFVTAVIIPPLVGCVVWSLDFLVITLFLHFFLLISSSAMSTSTLSNHVLLGLLPSTLYSIHCFAQTSSLFLFTCPYHLSTTLCVVIDLTAAFDTVSHNTVISMIARSSLPPAITQWLSCYLRGRQVTTSFRGIKLSTSIVCTASIKDPSGHLHCSTIT